MAERKEAWIRIVILIVSGIILYLWRILVIVLAIINWFIVMFTKRRNKDIADFCETWNTQFYVFTRYITFVTNERPFPFKSMAVNISKFKK